MDLSVETITPEMAKKYLMFNTSNRKARKSLIATYAREMCSGNWKLTHQGVAFDCNGTLLDGQHRLHAIVDSGVSVQMLVARGVESKTQLVMDDHAKRNAGDALTLSRNEKITQVDVAIIRNAVRLSSTSWTSALTKQELDHLIDEFRPALNFIAEMMPNTERGVTSAPAKAAVALAWFYAQNLDRLKCFCDILTGRQLPESSGDRAAVMAREWLLRTGMQSSELRIDGFKKTQRAIVAFLSHQDVSKLYGTSVYYPWPLVDPVRK